VIAWLLKAGKLRILLFTAALVAVIAFADWFVGRSISLAVLYIIPMMLGAVVLRPGETAGFAVLCATLRALFDTPASPAEHGLRFAFAAAAYFVSGLFVTELVRNHESTLKHLQKIEFEQGLRHEAEEQLRVLVESSPAAVLTVDERGVVIAANASANRLLAIPETETLIGRYIGSYLPTLNDALALDPGRSRLRASAQCQGLRYDGEMFLAQFWFSLYSAPSGKRVAAIVVDSSEELRDREEQGLREMLKSNSIGAAAVTHEVRNFCNAITVLCGNLSDRLALAKDEDLQALMNLADGLRSIASHELQSHDSEVLEDVPLRKVLDDLRIVIEPAWREIDGTVAWRLPTDLPSVVGDQHGLLQAFLNLAQNSLRAVQSTGRTGVQTAEKDAAGASVVRGETEAESGKRELNIQVCQEGPKVLVRFQDSGPGVAKPENLFQPFQEGAAGSGLGLYVSRFIVRSYGGELRFEPQPAGSCFLVELVAVGESPNG
jgi:signal transduction histidine kinase